MATGSFGVKRGATISPDDIDVYLLYSPSREQQNTLTATLLNANQLLTPVNDPNGLQFLGGMYNLKLPSSIFNAKGFYSLLIRGKTIKTNIVDCGVLSARPDIKGLILDSGRPEVANFQSKFTNGGLVGYRIEYVDSVTKKLIPNFFRIITSSNRCEPVVENLTNTNQKAIRYRFNDTGSLVFLTLTPSSAPNVKPNAIPFIGDVNQEILIRNTFFDELMIEIEMTDQTIETLSYALYGNQSKSLADGKYTIYTPDNQIYKQYNLYEILDSFGNPLFDVREQTSSIDTSKELSTIKQSIQQ